MQESSEGTYVESSLVGKIDGFLFALTRFGRDPSRYSASAEMYQLPGRDIAAEYIKQMDSDDGVPLSISGFSPQSEGYQFLEDTLSSFLQQSIARPTDGEPDENAIGLATWYLIEYISSMSDPLGQIYSAKLSIDGRTSDCIFITCSEQFLVIRMHTEEA